ncbi:heavy metal translocating P-type ATPase metal-binding domain-containing protein [Methyloprofundus sp.]|uniref:heavy metal translocating P-type ATPase metal-binding domain-containing protein n=1 Tax=Methyloprofundus sp. TaxID=2020875 RepID=UPI003D0BC75F
MSENKINCALCGLAVEIDGFNVETTEGLKLFCCAGCLSVYRLFNGDKIQE